MPIDTARRIAGHRSREAIDGKDVSLQVMIPARIKHEVSIRAAHEGATHRTVILTALKAIGFEISDDELCDKRKVR